jgi:hypothetical protein
MLENVCSSQQPNSLSESAWFLADSGGRAGREHWVERRKCADADGELTSMLNLAQAILARSAQRWALGLGQAGAAKASVSAAGKPRTETR